MVAYACGVSAAVRARTIAVPVEVEAVDTLVDPNYTYACEMARRPSDARLAEQWARAVFEDAPAMVRWLLRAGWVVGLGLRLGPSGSDSYVFGWQILSRSPEMIVLGIESYLLCAHLVVRVDDARVVHVTFVRYERRATRIIWAIAKPIHQLVIPWLLRHAQGR